MVNLIKYNKIINVGDLKLDKIWENDPDTGEKTQVLHTFITYSDTVFEDFFTMITGITEIPYISSELHEFNNYLQFLRSEGLKDFERANNLYCEVGYDENDNIVLLAVLKGVREYLINYICLDCFKHGSYEINAYNNDEALENGCCSYCGYSNLIESIDMKKHNVAEDYCIYCDSLNYYDDLSGFDECIECGRLQNDYEEEEEEEF